MQLLLGAQKEPDQGSLDLCAAASAEALYATATAAAAAAASQRTGAAESAWL